MRTLVGVGATAGAALGLAACHPPHVRHHAAHGDGPMSVNAFLICPLKVGGLARVARTADGQSCDYAGPASEAVNLKRLAVADGQSPRDALAPTEAALRPLIPARAGPAPVSVDADGENGDDDHAKIDLPGVHINAQGDKAEVRVFGVTVNANGQNADVHVGHDASRTVVQAGPNGAEIRVDDVDEANAELILVLIADKPGPSKLHAVGYLARGPVAGPLAVATFRSTAGHQDWRRDRDLNALLDLNVKQ